MTGQPLIEFEETARLCSRHVLRLLVTMAILALAACAEPGADDESQPAASTVAHALTVPAQSSTPPELSVEALPPNVTPTSAPTPWRLSRTTCTWRLSLASASCSSPTRTSNAPSIRTVLSASIPIWG